MVRPGPKKEELELEPLPDQEEQATMERLNRMPLFALIQLDLSDDERSSAIRAQLHARRTTLSLAFGSQSAQACFDSKLWHPYQNTLEVFPGGMDETMGRSYFGPKESLPGQLYTELSGMFSHNRITSLHIMISLTGIAEELLPESVVNLCRLLSLYAPRLVSFKLWASGPFYYRSATNQYTLRDHFCPRLWNVLAAMVSVRTLWLDLTELIQDTPLPEFFDDEPNRPLRIELESLIGAKEQLFRNMAQLEEFHYYSNNIVPVDMITRRLVAIPALARLAVHCPDIHFEDYNRFCGSVASGRLLLEMDLHLDTGAGQVGQFIAKFGSLTRLEVTLTPNGARFIEIVHALQYVPLLEVLKLSSSQSSLFNSAEAELMAESRIVPLARLKIIIIQMEAMLISCENISLRALFSGTQTSTLLPSLMCFEMEVLGGGACTDCDEDEQSQDRCITAAVVEWFEQLPNIVLINYNNSRHPTILGGHTLGENQYPIYGLGEDW